MEQIQKLNGIERAVRKLQPVLTTISVTQWYAQTLRKELNSIHTFCRLNVAKVLRETPKAIQVEAHFNTDVSVNCYCCGLTLDTEISKASGIGPVCAKNRGVPRASLSDAPAIIEHMNQLATQLGSFTVWVPKRCIKTGLETLEQNTPPVASPAILSLLPGQIQVAAWLAKKNRHAEVLTVIQKKKETEKWVLFMTTVGEIGVPKSQILAGEY